MTNADVVIVGGGLGGSSLGAALAQAGHDVWVLERTESFEDRVRGEWLAPWGVAEAKQLGLYDALVAAGGHTLTRNILYDELTPPEQAEAGTMPLTALHPAGGPLCLEHVVTQNTLLERARDEGARILRGVTGVRVEGGSTPSVHFHHAGSEQEVQCRLVVGADGRASTVRRQTGIALQEDPVDHLLAGLLVEGADDWPEDLQATGKHGDVYYLVFPQGGGKVRLYADYSADQKGRFSGKDGARAFLECFDIDFLPHSQSLANARPVGPCGSFPSQDAWTERPFTEGVVLVGDAAGYNDPILGQGQSVVLRDVRIVRDLMASSADWSPALFEPYADERRERMRRLRLCSRFATNLFARFDAEAEERRARAFKRMAEQPILASAMLAAFTGVDNLPPEMLDEAAVEAIFAA